MSASSIVVPPHDILDPSNPRIASAVPKPSTLGCKRQLCAPNQDSAVPDTRMPRMLTLRALCERCEKAEAVLWCVVERTAFCGRCDTETHVHIRCTPHRRVAIQAASVVAALCPACTAAPAAVYNAARGTLLCDLCARRLRRMGAPQTAYQDVLLRDLSAAESVVFDRMDFSTLRPPSASPDEMSQQQQGQETVSCPVDDETNSQRSLGQTSRWTWDAVQPTSCCPRVAAEEPRFIDLSYFKTTVPDRCRSHMR